ncbi:FIP1[V]-like protein [Cucurbita moschata]|uniref:FIP1[V]-like protein n=1 Tax=Cucurbita moschata TaxID=3662 RepID=A0A6J1F2C2_CUCMO|nr:FIP1[V]-like protein [Cucurbita moschata]
MEDDDEFGDLYTDVLRPFASSSSSAPQTHQSSPAPPPLLRSIDLNRQENHQTPPFGPSYSKSVVPVQLANQTPPIQPPRESVPAGSSGFVLNLAARNDGEGSRVKGVKDFASVDVELPNRALEDRNFGVESGIVGALEKDVNLMDKDVKFDVEEENVGVEDDVGMEPVIPGLSPGGGISIHERGGNFENVEGFRTNDAARDRGDGGDDWDSDSEDELQIVLNDNDRGPISMERGGLGGDDEDDEDDRPLVILGDNDQNQGMEEQEWGEDAVPVADGERKEMGEAAKSSGGMVVAPKLGYSNFGYRPFHSQYKYVRPGAAPFPGIPASGPGVTPNQARPPVMGPVGGRGRGDWRPAGAKDPASMQKGFHSGFGMPGWGNNMGGRGFGGGLEFTLPSHKTIFEVDIDGFEEKPWKSNGVDISDFFNFGLNEDSWKGYCKQLEQLRLEATMQSKIRVYESGRTEQGYDPDLPPELAAAAGIHDISNGHTLGKSEALQNDLGKGAARLRPPLPTGRAIQVEGGYGERLPSIDTRPPRIRDSDAIIEIVLQDSLEDNSSTGNCTPDQQNDLPGKDFKEVHEAEDDNAQIQSDTEYPDNFSEPYNNELQGKAGRRKTSMNSASDNNIHEDVSLPFASEGPMLDPASRGHAPTYSAQNLGTNEERQPPGRTRNKSPHSPRQNSRVSKSFDSQEGSVGSLNGKRSPQVSSPVMVEVAQECSAEDKDAEHDELIEADRNTGIDQENVNFISTSTTSKNDRDDEVMENNEKLGPIVEPFMHKEDDDEDSKAASSENRKTRSGSSRDYQKWQDGVEEEVFQNRRSSSMGSVKKYHDENEQNFRRRDNEDKQDERNRMEVKGRKDAYAYRDWDPSLAHQHHLKPDGFDRRKERSNAEATWQRRDDDPYYRKARTEETRKREHDDETGSRHRGKIREMERGDKDDRHLTKKLDNGSYRAHYDKSVSSRHRERDDSLKNRYENVDSYYNKKRKDDEHLRRDHMDKDDILHGKRESKSHRKRERDEVFEPQKRDDLLRVRDNVGDHHSVGHKEEWLQRERGDRQRDKEDWHRLKQPREENLSKRDRDEGRSSVRGGHGAEEKAWGSHVRVKDDNKVSEKEYPVKDVVRHSEQNKRRDRIEEESSRRGREDAYSRRNLPSTEDRRSRLEKSTSERHAVNAFDNQRTYDKRQKESKMKNREVDGSDYNALGPSKKTQENQNNHRSQMALKGSDDHGELEHSVHHHGSRKHTDNASSGDEQQDSRRGRSKLERWTSHKEREFNMNSKSSSALLSKEIENNNGGSSEGSKHPDDSLKGAEAGDNYHLAEKKDSGDLDSKGCASDTKVLEDRHMDTVEKLKKRSERFKLPMPSEKEALVIKKMENEALPSSKSDAPADSEIKPERPARKRRWIGS